MSKHNPFEDYVFSLSKDDFQSLKLAVSVRSNSEKYGASSLEEFALLKERPIICPECDSTDYTSNGHTPAGVQRYRCRKCGKTFTHTSKSIFNSMKIDFDILTRYIQLMSFNLPLEAIEELCDISHPTALLWRHKVFSTVDEYQNKVWLKDRAWIDETFITVRQFCMRMEVSKSVGCPGRRSVSLWQSTFIRMCLPRYMGTESLPLRESTKL